MREAKVPEECKEKMAWKIPEDWLKDRTRSEKEWEVETGPLSWEEIQNTVSLEAVNRSEIPPEVWRNSESSRAREPDESDLGSDERGDQMLKIG